MEEQSYKFSQLTRIVIWENKISENEKKIATLEKRNFKKREKKYFKKSNYFTF
jgi:hypothetical protein